MGLTAEVEEGQQMATGAVEEAAVEEAAVEERLGEWGQLLQRLSLLQETGAPAKSLQFAHQGRSAASGCQWQAHTYVQEMEGNQEGAEAGATGDTSNLWAAQQYNWESMQEVYFC